MISIVIPLYNAAAHVALLFHMFRQQTGDCELIFVDDGSTDDTGERVAGALSSLPFPARLIRQPNAGAGAARNAGLRAARGEWLTFVDMDDLIAPDYAHTLSAVVQEAGFDVLVFDLVRLSSGKVTLPPAPPSPPRPIPVSREALLFHFLKDPKRFGPVNLLIKRSLLKGHALSFPEGCRYYEDYCFILRLFMAAERPCRLHRTLYGYVMRPGSAMGVFSADRFLCLELLQGLEGALQGVPSLHPSYVRWLVPRVYWSVLWQAALAFPHYPDFKRLAKLSDARGQLRELVDFPKLSVRAVAVLFLCSPRLAHALLRAAGKRRSAVRPLRQEEALETLRLLGAEGGE